MTNGNKRTVEIRLIVIVFVDVTNPTFIETLTATHPNPSAVADVVSSEVVSNLESVPYVDAVIVSRL